MPISQINPDGSVKIINSISGEVKDVKPEDLASYNPKLVAEYQSKLQTSQAVKSGALQLGDIPIEQRVGVVSTLGKDAAKPKTTPKDQATLNATNNLISNLEKRFQEAGGGETNIGPLARVLGVGKGVEGKLGINTGASTYNKEKAGFAATLKSLTGDTGVLTDQDFQRLSQLLPGLGSTKEEATTLLNDLRSQVAAKYGGKAEKTKLDTKEKNVAELLLPQVTSAVKQISEERKLPPIERQKVAENYARVSNPLQAGVELIKGDNPQLNSAASATGEIVGDITALMGGKALLGGIKKLPEIIGGSGKIAAKRASIAEGLKVNTKPLIEAGDEYVKTINPAAAKSWDTLKTALKEETDAGKLLNIVSDWGQKAYTSSGNVRAIAEGQLKNHLYKSARGLLQDASPEIAELTKQIARRKGVEGLLNKTAVPAAIGTAAATPIGIALYKLLGQRSQ